MTSKLWPLGLLALVIVDALFVHPNAIGLAYLAGGAAFVIWFCEVPALPARSDVASGYSWLDELDRECS